MVLLKTEKMDAESFKNYQRKIYPLSDQALELLLGEAEEVRFRKGEQVLAEGRRQDVVYFVKEGLTRVYLLRDGKDMTLWFTGPGEMIADSSGTVSPLNAEVLEDSVLLKMSSRRLEELFWHSLELANWGRKLAEHYLSEYEHYFICYSGTEARFQYERLVREHPDLIQKVPLKHIASYLQITPQSLSRIRAKK